MLNNNSFGGNFDRDQIVQSKLNLRVVTTISTVSC